MHVEATDDAGGEAPSASQAAACRAGRHVRCPDSRGREEGLAPWFPPSASLACLDLRCCPLPESRAFLAVPGGPVPCERVGDPVRQLGLLGPCGLLLLHLSLDFQRSVSMQTRGRPCVQKQAHALVQPVFPGCALGDPWLLRGWSRDEKIPEGVLCRKSPFGGRRGGHRAGLEV